MPYLAPLQRSEHLVWFEGVDYVSSGLRNGYGPIGGSYIGDFKDMRDVGRFQVPLLPSTINSLVGEGSVGAMVSPQARISVLVEAQPSRVGLLDTPIPHVRPIRAPEAAPLLHEAIDRLERLTLKINDRRDKVASETHITELHEAAAGLIAAVRSQVDMEASVDADG